VKATVLAVSDLAGKRAARFEGGDHGSSVSLFIGEFPPGTGPGLHRHPYDETFVIESGAAVFTVDGETLEAGAGQVVVVPAGAEHKFETVGEESMRQISVHPRDRMEQEWLEE
jgi:mannose-6-phosphate isomerase-like protein (cupin superfamily)